VIPSIPAAVRENLLLASRSPRRHEILKQLNLEFNVVPAADHIENGVSSTDPFEYPLQRARLKALDVSKRYPDAVVIAADTTVIVDGDVLDKPRDDAQAMSHLERLSGKAHDVVTGVVIRIESSNREFSGTEITHVRFRALSNEEIADYVASGEGRDKAGAYGVQGLGAALVRSIEGCYYNVVGLPVALLIELLQKV
jgi:septum formation protein